MTTGAERPDASLRCPARLADIRPLERGDLPEFAALFELVLGSGTRTASPTTVNFLERSLFDNPWVDPQLPSLVAVDERGRPVGFLAAEVRRLRCADRRLRLVWTAHMVVDPSARQFGAGGLLLRQMLNGPQDVTVTDSASEIVRQMWQTLGGQRLHVEGVYWLRLFRPWRAGLGLPVMRKRPRLRAALWPTAVGLDAATRAAARRYLTPKPASDTAVPLTPSGFLDAWPTITKGSSLYGDYDEAYLEWLFGELASVARRGYLVAHLVHDRSRRPLGSYVYYLRPGSRSEVLHVAAQRRNLARVFDHLLWHAYALGSAAIGGRMSPGLAEAGLPRQCLFWHRDAGLVHTRDHEVLCKIRAAESLFTRLDVDWYVDTLA
jgi:hypothetical protein